MNAELLPDFLSWLAAASLHASLAALVILALQKALSPWLPARWRFGLWLPFGLILLLPVRPDSPLSVERLWSAPRMETAAAVPPSAAASPVRTDGAARILAENAGEGRRSGESAFGMIAVGVWLTGFAVLTGIGLAAYRRQMRLVRQQARAVPDALRREVETAATAVGLKRLPDILCSRAVSSPAVTGPWCPVLLLPADFSEHTPPFDAALILRHEMLHLKHRDTVWDALFWGLNAAHWFNPVIWFAFLRLRADREMARDAEVLAEAGHNERAAYGGALLRLQLPPGAALFQAGFVGLVNGGHAMKRRMAGLVHHRRIPTVWHIAGVGLAGLIFLTMGASAEVKKQVPTAASAQTAASEPAVIAKAKSLMLERVQFDGASIQEVIDYIRLKSVEVDRKETDPNKKGVDLILFTTPRSLEAKVSFKLKNVSVFQVLEGVAAEAGLQVGEDTTGKAIMVAQASEFAAQVPAADPGSVSPVSALAAKLVMPRAHFSDANVADVARYIERWSKQTDPAGKGVRIKIAPDVKADKIITLNLRNVTVLDLTRIVSEQSGLAVRDDGTALVLVPRPDKK